MNSFLPFEEGLVGPSSWRISSNNSLPAEQNHRKNNEGFRLKEVLPWFSIALATQLTPQDKVGKTIGTLQAVQIISTAVGPVMGGLLAGAIGIRKTFVVTGSLSLFSLILFVLLYQDKQPSVLHRPVVETKASRR